MNMDRSGSTIRRFGPRQVVISLVVVVLMAVTLWIGGYDRHSRVKRETGGIQLSVPCEFTHEQNDGGKIDIYFDGTKSMLGFVTGNEQSEYKQLVQNMEIAANKAWKLPMVSYYKFGESIKKFIGKGYELAIRPEFYGDPDLARETYIDKVVRQADTTALTIIVTDLFQQQADITAVTTSIKSRFAACGLSTGIWAIRSAFHGTVYDIGPQKLKIDFYNSVPNEIKTYRPFYLIMFGNSSMIKRYQEKLRQEFLPGQILNDQDHFLIITSKLFDPPLSFEGSKVETKGKGIAIKGGICNISKGAELASQFKIQNDDQTTITYALRKPATPHGIRIDWRKITSQCRAYECPSKRNSDYKKPIAHADGGVRQISISSKDSLQLLVTFQLIPQKMKGSSTIIYECNMLMDEAGLSDSLVLEPWIDEWNMNPNLVYGDWKHHKSELAPRTWNLRNFVTTLWDSWMMAQPPCFGKLYLIIQP